MLAPAGSCTLSKEALARDKFAWRGRVLPAHLEEFRRAPRWTWLRQQLARVERASALGGTATTTTTPQKLGETEMRNLESLHASRSGVRFYLHGSRPERDNNSTCHAMIHASISLDRLRERIQQLLPRDLRAPARRLVLLAPQ